MRNIILAPVIALGLAACVGGPGAAKAAIVEACMEEDGGTQKSCTCFADLAVEKLDPEIVDALAEAAKADDPEAVMASKMGELGPAEMGQFVELMMEASSKCEMSM